MTTTAGDSVTLTFEERFTVALLRAHMTRKEFATYAGTTPKTLWRYATLRDEPNVGIVRLLAAVSGFGYEWLRPSSEEIEEGRTQGLPRLDSNQQPAD